MKNIQEDLSTHRDNKSKYLYPQKENFDYNKNLLYEYFLYIVEIICCIVFIKNEICEIYVLNT